MNFAQTPEFFQMYTAWHFVMSEKEESAMMFEKTHEKRKRLKMSGQFRKNGACSAAGIRKRAPGAGVVGRRRGGGGGSGAAGRITGAAGAEGGAVGAMKRAPGARKRAVGA